MANNLFLLNLLYDYPGDALIGKFADSLTQPGQFSDGIDLTKVSKVWLNAPIAPYDPFDPFDCKIPWTEVGNDGTLLVSSDPGLSCVMAVNIVPINPPDPRTTIRATLTFGSQPRAPQKFVSPFHLGDGSCNANAVFDSGFKCANTPSSGPMAWSYVIGPILNGPPPKTLWVSHHYSFIATIELRLPGSETTVTTFSQDPEMDVSC